MRLEDPFTSQSRVHKDVGDVFKSQHRFSKNGERIREEGYDDKQRKRAIWSKTRNQMPTLGAIISM
jgi:hypothetical protein